MEGELCIRSCEAGDQEQARWLILQGLGEHFGSIDETLVLPSDMVDNSSRLCKSPLGGFFRQEAVQTSPSHPGVRLHLSSFASTFTHHNTT
jgi:hypothetical protein